ncbi:hypothetical protein [Flavobacterium sp. DSP2-3-1]|uniref:hypothetical protein n=1 Tax=Flavobacterium sp. DSP2-3-1 TaxID=2804620 RepID=UPI003CE83789
MENNATTIEMLFERAEDYTKTTVELAKLYAVDKTADFISSLISQLAISIVFAMFAFLVNIGLSLWIGELVGKVYYGFFIVSSFYLLVAIILYIFKDQWIKTPISNFMIVKMLKKN